jgi:hypothetical protein
MEQLYPSRKENRWEHALARPLRGIKFETLELMRMDLFEYLDVLTTSSYDDKKSNKYRARELRRIALRLAGLTPRRAKAAQAAIKAGRVGNSLNADRDTDFPHIAQEAQRYWEGVQQ